MAMKKPYEAPSVRKVKLEIQTAVLGTCHSSPNGINGSPDGCLVGIVCYTTPIRPTTRDQKSNP